MAGVVWTLFVCVCMVHLGESSASTPCTCVDTNGSPVDWFFVYKAPSVEHDEAVAPFLYMDSDSIKFRMSPVLVDDAATPFARTLMNSVYRKHPPGQDIAYLMYNDEVPNRTDKNDTSRLLELTRASSRDFITTKSAELLRLHGHTKGVLATDSKTGFWLTHSVPKFPPRVADVYEYPSTAMRYAQHVLCVSLSVESVNIVTEQLQFNYPHIYESHIPDELLLQLPGLQTLVKKKPVDDDLDHFRVATFATLDGEPLMNFAKNDVFNASLYRDLLAPRLRSNLRVETWQNGKGGKLGPDCDAKLEYRIENIAAIDFGDQTYDNKRITFPSTKDHAKWAVAVQDDDPMLQQLLHTEFDEVRDLPPRQRETTGGSPWQPWTCVGDVNRMMSQFVRGGGTTCFSNALIWQQLTSLIADVDSCDSSQSA